MPSAPWSFSRRISVGIFQMLACMCILLKTQTSLKNSGHHVVLFWNLAYIRWLINSYLTSALSGHDKSEKNWQISKFYSLSLCIKLQSNTHSASAMMRSNMQHQLRRLSLGKTTFRPSTLVLYALYEPTHGKTDVDVLVLITSTTYRKQQDTNYQNCCKTKTGVNLWSSALSHSCPTSDTEGHIQNSPAWTVTGCA